MPEARTLHTDAILSNFSVQYRNEDLIWREVMPITKVNYRSDKFIVYTKNNAYKNYDDAIGPKSHANEVDLQTSTDNYSVKDHALADWLPQESIDNADNVFSMESDVNDFLNMLLDNAQELRVATVLQTAANFPSGNKVTLSGTSQWSGSADDPIANVQTAVESTFIRANTLVFGIDAWLVFRRLPEVIDAVKGSVNPGGFATNQDVAQLFDVNRVLVGRRRLITSKEGQTDTYARAWGKHMTALYIPPGEMGQRTVAFAKTFVEQDRMTQRDFDVKRGVKGAHYFKVGWNSDEKIIASDVGYLIENAVA